MLRSKRLKKVEKVVARVKKGHTHSPFVSYLKEVIYGAIDGIITTFAVVAGFSGAALSQDSTTQLSFVFVLLFGLANLVGDGVSMGLGNFLAVRSEQGLYRNLWKKEQNSSVTHEDAEVAETMRILLARGFSEAEAKTLTDIYRKNESFWIEFLLNNELKVANPMGESAVYTGAATFAAFIAFGFIPLMPFIVMHSVDPATVFQLSATGAFVALVLLGILKWRIVGTHPLRSVLEIVIVGGVAASVAFFVGTLFTI